MSNRKKNRINPFYVLLVVTGMLFLVTACSYGLMTLRAIRDVDALAAETGLMPWIDRHGAALMLGEVAAIGTLSVLAMATDKYWDG